MKSAFISLAVGVSALSRPAASFTPPFHSTIGQSKGPNKSDDFPHSIGTHSMSAFEQLRGAPLTFLDMSTIEVEHLGKARELAASIAQVKKQLVREDPKSPWLELMDNPDFVSLVTGHRYGCTLNPTKYSFLMDFSTPRFPLLTLGQKRYFGHVMSHQLFIYDHDEMHAALRQAGLLRGDQELEGDLLWQHLSETNLRLYHNMRSVGDAHGIDRLNASACGSYATFLRNEDVILSREMLLHAHRELGLSAAGLKALLERINDSGFVFRLSESNWGVRLPKCISADATFIDRCATEFDLELGEEAGPIIPADPDDERAVDSLMEQDKLLLERFYDFWAQRFNAVTQMPDARPKETTIGDRFARRHFVPVSETKWWRFCEHFELARKLEKSQDLEPIVANPLTSLDVLMSATVPQADSIEMN